MLTPLRKSEYIIESTKDFTVKVKAKEVPNRCQTVLLDVKSLFTNISLYQTNGIILRRIYDEHELQTSITRLKMTELFTLVRMGLFGAAHGWRGKAFSTPHPE